MHQVKVKISLPHLWQHPLDKLKNVMLQATERKTPCCESQPIQRALPILPLHRCVWWLSAGVSQLKYLGQPRWMLRLRKTYGFI